jgi:hypothetical protein
MAAACARFVVRASAHVPSDYGTDIYVALELVRDAFMEAGFLAVDRRPLKVHHFRFCRYCTHIVFV